MQHYKPILVYLLKFLGLFALLFYGTEAVIAFASPGGFYSPFVEKNLNVIVPYREFLLQASQGVLALGGWRTTILDSYMLGFPSGAIVRIGYDCLGYGILSFWIAFVFANRGGWQRKAAWMIGGCLALVGINILRIALVLLAAQKGWPIPLGWDHHTWFNIIAYLLIFAMIWGFDRHRSNKNTHKVAGNPTLQIQKDIPKTRSAIK